MRLLASAGLLLGLVAASAAASTCGLKAAAAEGRILVRDRFLDDGNRAALLCRASHQSVDPAPGTCRRRLAVPSWFSHKLLSLLRPERATAALPMMSGGDGGEVLLPITEEVGDKHEHQDVHVSGASKGGLADGNVGVVYLQGEGNFVLTDTATGLEHRVPITPGKLISWPNAGFTHRVESAGSRIRRRMLGPMAFDAASNSLVGVGTSIPMPCPQLYGYECVDPQAVSTAAPQIDGADCGEACFFTPTAYEFSQWDSQTGACGCMATSCNAFVAAPGYQFFITGFGVLCPSLNVVPDDPILISAGSFRNRTTVRAGKAYALLVTMTMPAATRRLAEEEQQQLQRELKSKPLNTTDYALLVTPAVGGAVYKRTVVRPALKPAALKKPQVQSNGSLLWDPVPMPLYMSKAYTRKFKIIFKVPKTATGPLVFQASVWKGGAKLENAAGSPVTVTVIGK